jgi:ssDNA-binding Zn-finger/Zn-ribbon topoisomerase 1
MSFIKTGDAEKIIAYYNPKDFTIERCPKCNKPLVYISLDEENQLVCEECDIDYGDKNE